MQMMQSNYFSGPRANLELSENFLPQRFAHTETRLMEQIGSPDVTPEEFESLCESKLDVFIIGVQPEVVGALESVENRCDEVRKQLDEEQAHRHRLLGINRLCELYGDKRRTPFWYWGLYIVLIIAAMAIFATNFGLIVPEREWIGLLSSPIVAAFSYFVVCEFLRRPDKDRFLRHIHWMGIWASIVMLVGFAVARALAYLLLSGSASSAAYSSGSFLNNQSSSTMDTLQMAAALVTFLAAMVTEVAFAGRLYISIAEYRAARCSREGIIAGLESVEEEIQELQDKLRRLGQELAQLRGFDEMAAAWKRAKLQELSLLFKEAQVEVRNRLMQQMTQLSTPELRELMAA